MTVFSWRNFCISVIDETLTPTGGTTCSALGGAVNRHLLRPRLTSARPSRRLSTIGSTMASVQISQGNSRDLPAYACRIYVAAFRASIGLWRLWPPHPAAPPHIRFLFIRPAFCLGLPSDSQSPATPLPPANTSPCRVCRGLSPPSRQVRHHGEPDSASHGATRHAWRTTKKPLVRGFEKSVHSSIYEVFPLFCRKTPAGVRRVYFFQPRRHRLSRHHLHK